MQSRVLLALVAMVFGAAALATYQHVLQQMTDESGRPFAQVHTDSLPSNWGINPKTGSTESPLPDTQLSSLSVNSEDNQGTRRAIKALLTPVTEKDPVEIVISALDKDPELRKAMLSDYFKSKDSTVEMKLRFVLSESQSADVINQAKDFLAKGTTEQKSKALGLIASIQDRIPEARAQVLQMLDHETDPNMLSKAIAAARPVGFREPQQTAQLIQRLHELKESEDSRISGAALITLAEWQGTASVEPEIIQNLRSQDMDQISVSMQILASSQFQSEGLKQQLLKVVERPDMAEPMRENALNLLRTYNLTQDDYDRLLRLKSIYYSKTG